MKSGRIVSLLPAVTAGSIAVLVGFTSSIAIVLQAAAMLGATAEQTSSMIAAVCFGTGVTSIAYSWFYKKPVLTAFSTTGAALLAASASTHSFNETIGAFAACGVLILISGVTGWFEKVLNRVPTALASAMLAGVLLRFGLDVFGCLKTQPIVVSSMLVVYIAMKNRVPRFTVLAVLAAGLAASAALGLIHLDSFHLQISTPVFTMPTLSISALIGVAIPLFIVTMASQNLPGIAVMRACGYQAPISSVISGTGLATVLLAPFGAFGINFAAITAAIVMGPEAHEDAHKRYAGAIAAGILYLFVAIFAATITLFFQALPREFVLSLAGIALFSTIANSLSLGVKDESSRDAAILTFLVTASGLTLQGVGSAFWGLVAGGLMLFFVAKPTAPRA
ncbi:benzoate/H(+) symporter BenE family transporter [soil metagenome]